jgi:glycosyltransferase involved in cell wall biosynthesis
MHRSENQPLISAILPTADRRAFVSQATRYFLAQDYPNRELLIVDDGAESVADLVPADARIRYLRLDNKMALGAKRNLACREARGEIIVHWDDDDWMADWRLSYQVQSLIESQADVCGLSKLLFYDPAANQAWQYIYPQGQKFWVAGATLCYRKAFWRDNPFPNINIGEDTRFIWNSSSKKMLALDNQAFYVAMIHRANTSPKRTQDARYHSYPAAEIHELLGGDLQFYRELAGDAAKSFTV